MTVVGIHDWSVAIPRHRLARQSIFDAHGWANPALASARSGHRAVAWWDEDAVTLAVAATAALDPHGLAEGGTLIVGGATMPFLERHPSAIVAEALHLPDSVATRDVAGGTRAGMGALQAAADSARRGSIAIAVASDTPEAQPGSMRELLVGDAAVAFTVGPGTGRARIVGQYSARFDMADRQRGPGGTPGTGWEDRWLRDVLWARIVPDATRDALAEWGIAATDIDWLAVAAPTERIGDALAGGIGAARPEDCRRLANEVGDCGAASGPLALVAALDAARPGQRILAIAVGQGVDLTLLEAAEDIGEHPARLGPALDTGMLTDTYAKHLRFRGMIDADTGIRGAQAQAAPPSVLFRRRDMLTGFIGGQCAACGTVQFPLSRYCVAPNCRALDTQTPISFADRHGRMATFTLDRLSSSPEPPSAYGMIDFDKGGRVMMDFADWVPSDLAIGARVRPVFRRRGTDAGGLPRYFWKAAPVAREGVDG